MRNHKEATYVRIGNYSEWIPTGIISFSLEIEI